MSGSQKYMTGIFLKNTNVGLNWGQSSPQLDLTPFVSSFDVRDRPLSIARIYSEPTLFDEPTRAVMNVTQSPAALVISKLLPADSGRFPLGGQVENCNYFPPVKVFW